MTHDPRLSLSNRLRNLEAEILSAARALLEGRTTEDLLFSAVRTRNEVRDALAAVEAVDDRVFDAAGRWTGARRSKSYLDPSGAFNAASPQSHGRVNREGNAPVSQRAKMDFGQR
jgi:hypothetical protein